MRKLEFKFIVRLHEGNNSFKLDFLGIKVNQKNQKKNHNIFMKSENMENGNYLLWPIAKLKYVYYLDTFGTPWNNLVVLIL